MPIYEYICEDCDLKFEALRLMSQSDTPIECSACNGTHTSRTVSSVYARSGGKAIAGGNGNCAGCSGSCTSCSH